MSEINKMDEIEFPLLAPEAGTTAEDKGTGYNFGKRWSYLPGILNVV